MMWIFGWLFIGTIVAGLYVRFSSEDCDSDDVIWGVIFWPILLLSLIYKSVSGDW